MLIDGEYEAIADYNIANSKKHPGWRGVLLYDTSTGQVFTERLYKNAPSMFSCDSIIDIGSIMERNGLSVNSTNCIITIKKEIARLRALSEK